MTRQILALALAALALGGCYQNTSSNGSADNGAISTEAKTTLPDGLKYTILKPGNPGGKVAKDGDTVVVNYTGWLTDGTKFDSSLDRNQPFDFTLGKGEVIKGWDEGVAGMVVGEKRKLVVPPDLGYGDRAMGPIPPGSTLIFEVQLLDVK